MTLQQRAWVVLAELGPLLAACGSSDPAPAGGRFHSELGSCSGTFEFDPAEPVVGKNRLDATLVDSEESPLEHAVLDVQTWMPAHGHGSSAKPAVDEQGAGRYAITNLVFEMPGEWQLTINVDGAELSDRFVIPVAVR